MGRLAKNYEVGFVFGAKKAAGFDNTFQGIGASIKGIGSAIAGIAGAYVGVQTIKDAVSTFATFEQSMANVKAISGATGEEFQDLEAAAMEMGRKTSKTAAESADALSYMALAGWDTQQSIAGLEPILRSSEAFSMDLATASDLVTDSMSALGVEVQDLGGYLDIVSKAQASANANGQQMMEAFLGVGGKLKDMNVPLEESAALMGLMANRGIKGSEAGNSLNAIMANLLTPTGQAKKALDALGVSAFDSMGNFKGLENTFVEIQGALEGLTEEQQRNYKDMIAGKNQSAGFTAILNGLGMEYADLKAQITDCDGALMETAETMNATMEGAFKRLESATDDMKIQLVKTFEGDLTGAIDWAAEKIPAATGKIVGSISWLKEKAGPVVTAFTGQVRERFSMAQGVLGKFMAGDWKGGSADILGGMGFDSASISVLHGYVESTVAAFGKAAGYVKPFFSAIGQGVANAQPGLQAIQNFAVQKLVPAFQRGQAFLTEKVFPPVMKFFTENIPKVGAIFTNVWGILQPILSGIGQNIRMIWEIGEPVISAFIEGITGFGSGVITVLEGVTAFISGVFAGDWGKAWDGITKIFGGAFSAMESLAKVPLNAVIGLLNKAIGGINSLSFTVPDWVPGIGGKEFGGFGIPTIPALAAGGIATSPTLAMVGEGRESEAILPLSKLKDLLGGGSLLETGPIAALIQRILSGGGLGGGGDQFSYNPTFVFEGPVSKEMADYAADVSFEKFKQWYKQLKAEQKRKGLATG